MWIRRIQPLLQHPARHRCIQNWTVEWMLKETKSVFTYISDTLFHALDGLLHVEFGRKSSVQQSWVRCCEDDITTIKYMY